MRCFCDHDKEHSACASLQVHGTREPLTGYLVDNVCKEGSVFETSETEFPVTRRHTSQAGKPQTSRYRKCREFLRWMKNY